MRKTLLHFIVACMAMGIIALGLVGCSTEQNCGFYSTGIVVYGDRGAEFLIIKDKNGWLYYNQRGRGLALVLGADGMPTKDIKIFE